MKLLVFSDSHGSIDRLSFAVKQAAPDAILHLGDNIGDARKLHIKFPDVAFYMVKGNCDTYAAGEIERLFYLEGVKIYMTHGHIYNVKNGMNAFAYRAQEVGAGIAFYGHTHIAMIQQYNGIWLMNPGQMERHDSKRSASYGIVKLEKGRVDMEIVYLDVNRYK